MREEKLKQGISDQKEERKEEKGRVSLMLNATKVKWNKTGKWEFNLPVKNIIDDFSEGPFQQNSMAGSWVPMGEEQTSIGQGSEMYYNPHFKKFF